MTKTTHTIPDVEGLILEKLDKLRDSKDRVEQRKLRAEIIRLEKHHRDCNDKTINGKKYPERMKGFSDDKPMNKKVLLELIDSVETLDMTNSEVTRVGNAPNLEGVSVGKNTFEYVDKGWSTPKTMSPSRLFK